MSETLDPRILTVVALMRGNLHRGLPLETMAQAVNLSPSRFHHLFKNETGMSPARYLKTLRLEQAKELLEGSFLSVKEIRVRVGIGDESHFVRDFKTSYGVTPTQHRARYFSREHGRKDEPVRDESDSRGEPETERDGETDGNASRQPASTDDDQQVPALALPAYG